MIEHDETVEELHEPNALSMCISNIATNIDGLPLLYTVCKRCATIGGIAVFLEDMYAQHHEPDETMPMFLAKYFAAVHTQIKTIQANKSMTDKATTPMPSKAQ